MSKEKNKYRILVELPDGSGYVPMRMSFAEDTIALVLEATSGVQCSDASVALVFEMAKDLKANGINYSTLMRKKRDESGVEIAGKHELDNIQIKTR